MTVHLFYGEPDPDRWLPGDRYPRKLIRRLLRGTPRPGGQKRVFLNLCAGLERLGVPYRINDFRSLRRNPEAIAGVLGKAPLFFGQQWSNPILLGPSVINHPIDHPHLLRDYPDIRRLLVPGPWMVAMCQPTYGDAVHAWPIGIDTDYWHPIREASTPALDVLVYDKLLWNRERKVPALLTPLCEQLDQAGLRYQVIRYGHYQPEQYRALLGHSRLMVFLCEHETQGLAYQEALACDVPVLAWQGSGVWEDPDYYPDRVRFGPVSSTPYWSPTCGERFAGITDFSTQLQRLLDQLCSLQSPYAPRQFILAHLGLETSAQAYLGHLQACLGATPTAMPQVS